MQTGRAAEGQLSDLHAEGLCTLLPYQGAPASFLLPLCLSIHAVPLTVAAFLMALNCLCPALEGHVAQAASCHELAIFTCPFIIQLVLMVGLSISGAL
eukprot:1045176-Pelagomonas_calceolata.AAC.8